MDGEEGEDEDEEEDEEELARADEVTRCRLRAAAICREQERRAMLAAGDDLADRADIGDEGEDGCW